jgi:hypothetical protein
VDNPGLWVRIFFPISSGDCNPLGTGGSSPEPLSLLRLGEAGEILAQTTDGTLYEFHYGKNSTWEEIAQPSENPAVGESCVTGTGIYLVLPPPGKVKSRVSENCVYMESAYHLELALLENGQVWVWEYERYAYTELFVMFFLLIGCAAGVLILLLGLGLMIYQKIKKRS